MNKIVNLYKEKYEVYIGRKGRGNDGYFGNPFSEKEFGRTGCIEKYKEYFLKRIKNDVVFKEKVEGLRGKVLGCFCKPKACHGDIIVEYLEGSEPDGSPPLPPSRVPIRPSKKQLSHWTRMRVRKYLEAAEKALSKESLEPGFVTLEDYRKITGAARARGMASLGMR